MATYYIDPAGNDSTGTGAVGAPWKTLSKACATVVANAGHIIHVNQGNYTETVQSVLKTGVSIEGEGNNSFITSTYAGAKATILAESGSGDINGNQHISGIRMYGGVSYTAPEAIRVAYRKNVKVYNCNISNFRTGAITFLGGEPPSTYRIGNEIHDCVISNCCTYVSGNTGALWVTGQDGMLIYNNVITANRADANNGDIIYSVAGYLKNVKIYNNTFTKIYVPGTTRWDFALELWNLYEGNEIYSNTINGSIDLSTGHGKGTGSYSVWVHNNTIGQTSLLSGGSLRGVLLESGMADVIIEKNYIRNVASGVFLQQGSADEDDGHTDYTVSNLRISYNVFNSIGSTTSSNGWGIHTSYEPNRGNDTYTNIYIWNNVIIASSGASTMYGIWIPDSGVTTNVSIRNNIVQGFTSSPVYANGTSGTSGGPTTITTLSIENNIFYNNGNNNSPRYTNITPSNDVTQNNTTTNPLFVSTSDFHLQATSPAINTGIHISDASVVTDYANNSIGNPPEKGVYEYVTTGGIPTITTTAITAIATTTATGGGNVTSANGGTVSARGVCWSTSSSPTILGAHTTDGSGTGVFVSSLTGLTPSVTYYVRAYATNEYGTGYGSQVTFTTLPLIVVPTVTTTAITSVTATTASSGGNVTADGGASVTARGVCWSITANPTATNDHTTNSSGTGSFTSSITGLSPLTTYHVRAYATNSAGTAYGNDIVFITVSSVVLPTITTTTVTSITTITALSGGNVTSEGGGSVTERGTVWNTTPDPTIDVWVGKNINGQGLGSFVTTIEYLTPGTTYYIRAYATNSAGTSYGSQLAFITLSLTVPVLTTTSISSITETTASSGGTISADGGASVTTRGVVWSTSTAPTIALATKTSNGTGTGNFTSSITGLTGNTTYYVRSYATNSVGTAYGNEIIFTTSPVLSTVVISSYSNVTQYSVTVVGNITSSGGSIVTARGIAYSTSPTPTIAGSHTTEGGGTGSYSSTIISLTPSTLYYIRAYSTNAVGTAYSSQTTFTTSDPVPSYLTIGTVHHYETVRLGYGALYNWYAATNAHGLAPTGWHVPTNAELDTLITYLGGNPVAGGYLKESGTTHWLSPNAGADNSSGFTALGSSWRNSDGTFSTIKSYFSCLSTDDSLSSGMSLTRTQPWAGRTTYPDYSTMKTNGRSIRCILDGVDPPDPGTMTDIDGNIYQTVKIGTQVWMKSNLRVTHYNNGTPIPVVTSNATWVADTDGAMCYYDNDINNV